LIGIVAFLAFSLRAEVFTYFRYVELAGWEITLPLLLSADDYLNQLAACANADVTLVALGGLTCVDNELAVLDERAS